MHSWLRRQRGRGGVRTAAGSTAAVALAAPRVARKGRRQRWRQGLTLVHFSAQRKRFLWVRGCISGLSRGCLGGVRGC